MIKPLVSVIIPVYNVANFLEQCIDSVCCQTLNNIEIILVDDGSTDGSSQICDKFARNDLRVKVIHNNNEGVSVARNIGIENANADWLVFVDGDDWLENDAIQVLYAQAIENNCDMVAGMHYENEINNEKRMGMNVSLEKSYYYFISSCRENLLSYVLEEIGLPELIELECNLSSPWAKIYKRDIILENNLSFIKGQKRGEDEVFNLYFVQNSQKIGVINKSVYHYRKWENSICKKMSKIYPEQFEIYEEWRKQVELFLINYDKSRKLRSVYNLLVLRIVTYVMVSYVNSYIEKQTSFKEAISGIKLYLNREQYRMAINELDLKNFSGAKKILVVFWKLGMYRSLFYSYKIRQNCNKRRKKDV